MRSRMLTPESLDAWHLVALVAELIHEKEQRAKASESKASSVAEDLVLERLLQIYPASAEDSPFHVLHARVMRGPDSARLGAFLSWVYESQTPDPAIHLDPKLMAETCTSVLYRLTKIVDAKSPRPATAIPSNPFRDIATVESAREALRRLEGKTSRVERIPDSEDDRLLIEAAVEGWRRLRFKRKLNREMTRTCRSCRTDVDVLWPTQHLGQCPGHPGFLRRTVAERALAMITGEGRTGPGEWRPRAELERGRTWPLRLFSEARPLEELETLVKAGAGEAPQLELLLTQWGNLKDRSREPCPFCGAVLSLEEMLEHTHGCTAHQAHREAEALEKRLEATLGGTRAKALLDLVSEHERTLLALRVLSDETDEYEGEMGWNGAPTSTSATEAPWLSAINFAAEQVGLGRAPRPRLPPLPGPEREALQRLLSEVKAPREVSERFQDVAVLRAALEERDQLVIRHGRRLRCPSCECVGLFPSRLFAHLRRCRGAPEMLLAREETTLGILAAEISALPSGLSETLDPFEPAARERPTKGEAADPEEHRLSSWDLRAHEQLNRLEKGERVISPHELEHGVYEWQHLQAAENATCPDCSGRVPIADAVAHVARCREKFPLLGSPMPLMKGAATLPGAGLRRETESALHRRGLPGRLVPRLLQHDGRRRAGRVHRGSQAGPHVERGAGAREAGAGTNRRLTSGAEAPSPAV